MVQVGAHVRVQAGPCSAGLNPGQRSSHLSTVWLSTTSLGPKAPVYFKLSWTCLHRLSNWSPTLGSGQSTLYSTQRRGLFVWGHESRWDEMQSSHRTVDQMQAVVHLVGVWGMCDECGWVANGIAAKWGASVLVANLPFSPCEHAHFFLSISGP